jgi:hypothetical protein
MVSNKINIHLYWNFLFIQYLIFIIMYSLFTSILLISGRFDFNYQFFIELKLNFFIVNKLILVTIFITSFTSFYKD